MTFPAEEVVTLASRYRATGLRVDPSDWPTVHFHLFGEKPTWTLRSLDDGRCELFAPSLERHLFRFVASVNAGRGRLEGLDRLPDPVRDAVRAVARLQRNMIEDVDAQVDLADLSGFYES